MYLKVKTKPLRDLHTLYTCTYIYILLWYTYDQRCLRHERIANTPCAEELTECYIRPLNGGGNREGTADDDNHHPAAVGKNSRAVPGSRVFGRVVVTNLHNTYDMILLYYMHCGCHMVAIAKGGASDAGGFIPDR